MNTTRYSHSRDTTLVNLNDWSASIFSSTEPHLIKRLATWSSAERSTLQAGNKPADHQLCFQGYMATVHNHLPNR
jgi:hypothetical protein